MFELVFMGSVLVFSLDFSLLKSGVWLSASMNMQ